MATFLNRIFKFRFGRSNKEHSARKQRRNSKSSHSSAKSHQIVPASASSTSTAASFNSNSSATSGNSGSNSSCSAGRSKINNVRTRRLMKEYREITKSVESYRKTAETSFSVVPFEVDLVNDSLYEWNVKLRGFDQDSNIYHEMRQLGIDSVLLNATFPDNFPFEPPFIRVVSPIIEKGFVMEGGAICMELLTSSGWSSAYNMEAVIMQLAASLVKGQAKIKSVKKGFSKKDAEASFKSIVKTHSKYGWVDSPLSEG